MEQVRLFLAEEAGLMMAGFAVLNLILFAITLHRIKWIEKRGRELLHTMEGIQGQMNDFVRLNCQAEEREEKASEQSVKPEKTETPEELLNAVLTEVFP